jgi:hypothetical protein
MPPRRPPVAREPLARPVAPRPQATAAELHADRARVLGLIAGVLIAAWVLAGAAETWRSLASPVGGLQVAAARAERAAPLEGLPVAGAFADTVALIRHALESGGRRERWVVVVSPALEEFSRRYLQFQLLTSRYPTSTNVVVAGPALGSALTQATALMSVGLTLAIPGWASTSAPHGLTVYHRTAAPGGA